MLLQINCQGYIFLGYRTNYIRFNICIEIGTYLLAAILFIVQTASWPTCWRLGLKKITYFKSVLGIIERASLGHFPSVEKRGWKKILGIVLQLLLTQDAKHTHNAGQILSLIFPRMSKNNNVFQDNAKTPRRIISITDNWYLFFIPHLLK